MNVAISITLWCGDLVLSMIAFSAPTTVSPKEPLLCAIGGALASRIC